MEEEGTAEEARKDNVDAGSEAAGAGAAAAACSSANCCSPRRPRKQWQRWAVVVVPVDSAVDWSPFPAMACRRGGPPSQRCPRRRRLLSTWTPRACSPSDVVDAGAAAVDAGADVEAAAAVLQSS